MGTRFKTCGFRRCSTLSVLLKSIATQGVAFFGLVLILAAQDAPSPDKNNYTVLNPTPDTELLELSADRPVNAATGVWRRGLTHRDEGHPLVSLIASNTTTAGVEGRFAIHQKAISVMTMRKLHLHKPATV